MQAPTNDLFEPVGAEQIGKLQCFTLVRPISDTFITNWEVGLVSGISQTATQFHVDEIIEAFSHVAW